jgi:hypothetical protein
MATPKRKDAASMIRDLDSAADDVREVHIASPVDINTFLKQFATPATRCRSHVGCVVVRSRSVDMGRR